MSENKNEKETEDMKIEIHTEDEKEPFIEETPQDEPKIEIHTEDEKEPFIEGSPQDEQGLKIKEEEKEGDNKTPDIPGEDSESGDVFDDDKSESEPDDDPSGDNKEEESKFGSDGKIHSGLFDKKKNKKDPMKEKISELEDRVKRQMAEFENFRKRSDKEKTLMYDMGVGSAVEKILPVIDNFERGLADAPDDAFSEGMQMIYKQLRNALDELGVKEIEALGKTFDPELHNAVMHIDDEAYGESEVVEVLQKGYTHHDSVVRHSMVKVAN